jgi:hypothetical protein
MARRECAMAALFPAERIGGLASLQPATLRLAADVRYGGHARRSDGQQGFAECPLCLQWRPNLCVATNRRDVPLGDSRVRAGRGIWISRERYHVTRRPTLPFRVMSDSPLTPLK